MADDDHGVANMTSDSTEEIEEFWNNRIIDDTWGLQRLKYTMINTSDPDRRDSIYISLLRHVASITDRSIRDRYNDMIISAIDAKTMIEKIQMFKRRCCTNNYR